MQKTFQQTQTQQPQPQQLGQTQTQQGVDQQKKPAMRPTWRQTLQQINALLTPAKEAAIIMSPNPTFDTLAGSLALSEALKKIGRRSSVVTPKELDKEKLLSEIEEKDRPKNIPGIDQILSFLPQKQLSLIVDYAEGSFSQGKMDKSSDGLILTLAPEKGQKPIEPLNIDSQIYESKIDVSFLMEISDTSHLQEFYTKNQAFFSKAPIINVDYHKQNTNYGSANLIDVKAVSLSEVVTLMLYDLRFIFDPDIAKLLYAGIQSKTSNFSKEYFSANMLEATSICLRYQKPIKPLPPQKQIA